MFLSSYSKGDVTDNALKVVHKMLIVHAAEEEKKPHVGPTNKRNRSDKSESNSSSFTAESLDTIDALNCEGTASDIPHDHFIVLKRFWKKYMAGYDSYCL